MVLLLRFDQRICRGSWLPVVSRETLCPLLFATHRSVPLRKAICDPSGEMVALSADSPAAASTRWWMSSQSMSDDATTPGVDGFWRESTCGAYWPRRWL